MTMSEVDVGPFLDRITETENWPIWGYFLFYFVAYGISKQIGLWSWNGMKAIVLALYKGKDITDAFTLSLLSEIDHAHTAPDGIHMETPEGLIIYVETYPHYDVKIMCGKDRLDTEIPKKHRKCVIQRAYARNTILVNEKTAKKREDWVKLLSKKTGSSS